MEKVRKDIQKKIPPTKLFEEDLKDIFNSFHEAGYSEIEIITKKYKYNEEELFDQYAGEEFDKIRAWKGKYESPELFQINFDDIFWNGVEFSYPDSLLKNGLGESIERILAKKKRISHFENFLGSLWMVYFLLIIFVMNATLMIEIIRKNWSISLPSLFALLIIFWLIQKRRRNIVHTKNLKKEESERWKEKRDIALFVISIGGLLFAILEYLK